MQYFFKSNNVAALRSLSAMMMVAILNFILVFSAQPTPSDSPKRLTFKIVTKTQNLLFHMKQFAPPSHFHQLGQGDSLPAGDKFKITLPAPGSNSQFADLFSGTIKDAAKIAGTDLQIRAEC